MLYVPFSGRETQRMLVALALASAAPAPAQFPATPDPAATVQRLPHADDPAEKLAVALRVLAVSPRDLAALIEAGRDALTLGDPNAAVGFFGRASEVSPRDGRVKAGLGAALVQLEKPRDALRYFQEASALGVADADLAGDRGLAYDLIGDPAHAQRDYQTVLAAHPDDDAARRRLALSQGISGNRAAAIATLDPLIRRRDIAAWRAQTFVLAMTGDTSGANAITRIMLPQQQTMLQPFLERLATLAPADKARAVHFGEMPAGGRSYSDTQLASLGTPASYAPVPVVSQPAPRRVASAVVPPPPAGATPPATPPPSPATVRQRFVSPTGVPLRRIEHSTQEMMALGIPRYDYVPASEVEPRRTTSVAPAIAATTAPAPVAPPPPGAAGIAVAPAVRPALAGPPAPAEGLLPGVAAGIAATTSTAPAMPLGASGTDGHFDVPHEIADRRPVPRAVQTAARPPAASHTANPTVLAASRARGGTEFAAADRPVRGGHGSRGRTVANPADAAPAPVRTGGRHGRDTGSVAAKADTDEGASPERKGKRGGRSRVAARDGDADGGGSSKTHGKDRPDRDRTSGDTSDGGGRTGRSDKAATAARVYVQVAGGANRDDMDKAWAGVKARAPDLMKGRTPSTTPLHATNRLLVGPFKDEDEAQAFVNRMAGKGLSGFTFRSGKGQKIERVGADR